MTNGIRPLRNQRLKRPGDLRKGILRRHIALPTEHGAWIWWIGPLLIGAAAGEQRNADVAVLFLTALAAFLARHPLTLLVKVRSGRRSTRDLAPAAFWAGLYSFLASAGVILLLLKGHGRVLWLAVPGLPVFAWHLWLVNQRAERGQRAIELAVSGVLSLTAPAAYWLAQGNGLMEPWLLWLLTWLQTAASIVHVYLRLEQRRLDQMPSMPERWRMGTRSLLYHSFNLLLSLSLALSGLFDLPFLVPGAYALLFLDAFAGVVHPAVGAKPSAIGLRQLAASSIFVLMMILAYSL